MAFDWKQLEQDDQKRDRRALLTLGISWTAIGVVGTLVILAIGQTEKLPLNLIWLGIGIITLILGLRARRQSAGTKSLRDDEHVRIHSKGPHDEV